MMPFIAIGPEPERYHLEPDCRALKKAKAWKRVDDDEIPNQFELCQWCDPNEWNVSGDTLAAKLDQASPSEVNL